MKLHLAVTAFVALTLAMGPAWSIDTAAADVEPCTLKAVPAHIQRGRTITLTASCTTNAVAHTWTGGTCASGIAATCSDNPTVTTTYSVSSMDSTGLSSAPATLTVRPVDLMPVLMLLLD